MATVARYSEQQVQPTGFNPRALSGDSFGAAQGRALREMGRSFTKQGERGMAFAARMQEREDADVAFRAQVGMESDWMETEQRVRAERKGRNAKGVLNDADEWWSQAQHRYEDGLNPRQRQILAKQAARIRNTAIGSAQNYENRELERSHDESWAAAKQVVMSNAAQNPSPKAIEAATLDIKEKNRYQGARKGWDGDTIKAQDTADLTNLHTNVIRGMVNEDGGGKIAQAYFDRYAEQIDGLRHDDIKPVIDKAVLAEESKAIADSLSGAPYSAALQRIAQIPDTRLREAARKEFMLNKRDEEQIRVHQQRAAADAVWATIARGGRPTAGALAGMSGAGQMQVRRHFDARARAQVSATTGRAHARRDDFRALDEVEEQIKRGNITSPEQLERYEPFLKETTYRGLRKSINARKQISYTDTQRMFQDSTGMTIGEIRKKKPEEWAAYQEYMSDNIRRTGRPEDAQKISDKFFMAGTTERKYWMDKSTTYGEALAAGKGAEFVPNIPARDVPVTGAAVEATNRMLKGSGVVIPNTKKGRAQFYGQHQVEANRWLEAQGLPSNPATIGAVSALRARGKPVTRDNVGAVLDQIK